MTSYDAWQACEIAAHVLQDNLSDVPFALFYLLEGQGHQARLVAANAYFGALPVCEALRFDRAAARGMRLNIASGTAGRFEPGQQRTVELVD